jgi:hydroxyacylglutathione hydrolase
MMSLLITSYILGSLQNNSYLVVDPISQQALIIDPSSGCETILKEVASRRYHLVQVWLTHAHFDHFTGLKAILDLVPSIKIGLHPHDLSLWHEGGGARYFGFHIEPLPDPDIQFTHGQILSLGESSIEVRHAPGHSPGHVVFYYQAGGAVFCGDLIFQGGIGRTDLPGGNYDTIIKSIHAQVLSLPGETRLLTGHGAESTVQQERLTNPFLLE